MLETVAWISLGVALLCSVVIAVDEVRHPQRMAVMNVVWPVTARYLRWRAVALLPEGAGDAQGSRADADE